MARTAKLHRLTALAIRRYTEDTKAAAPLHDGGGLYLRKRESSIRWYLRLTEPATTQQQWHLMFPDDPAGGYPHKSLADARQEAKRLWNLRSSGVDPRAQRESDIKQRLQAREAERTAADRRVTVRELFERWAATDLQPRIRTDGKRMGRKDGGAFARAQFERRVFPALAAKAIEEVRKADLLAILDAAKAEGKLRTANVLLSDLKQMFRFALARELVQRNPLDVVSKRDVGGTAVERDRTLAPSEIGELVDALPTSRLNARSAAAVWIILSTGARVGELMGAAWADGISQRAALRMAAESTGVKLGFVDLSASKWHLPETKNQRDHTIHLSEFAALHFRHLLALRELAREGLDVENANPWVFPNANGTGPLCPKAFGKQLSDRQRQPERRLKGRSQATLSLCLDGGRWTAHDLRRTAATLMAELGVSGDVIDECLNHIIESRVRRTYIRHRREAAQAAAFDLLGVRLEGLVGG
ncbi:MAG TPA: tyrosine-type recombinase/integrase [Albitalea sp.]|uniref:tyrosine-type recombinase/integrase n=1 Tax=Piscinibacter sp. TaxID=1903157 RepID=UPI002ED3110E